MGIQEIGLLILVSALLGWVTRRWQRKNSLLAVSVVAIYWLQPQLPLRYLDFWLPTVTLVVAIFSWLITAKEEERSKPTAVHTFVLITGLVLLLSISRYLDLGGVLDFIHPPQIYQVLIVWALVGGVFLGFIRWRKSSNLLLWGAFAGLLVVFVVIKTPQLAEAASALWRRMMGQSTSLAGADQIRWLGFSYLAFRMLHTIRDRQAGRLDGYTLRDYLIYLLFFPAITAGPIDRAEHFIPALNELDGRYRDDLAAGGMRVVSGLFKKFVIADSLSLIALGPQNALQVETPLGAWLLLYAYAFQIFLDFSGYTDLVIGMGQFMNIRLPENFQRPYRQPNLTQFWNNWHITLTQWFRSYFFYPLSRALRRQRKYSAFIILLITQVSTMVLVGLWHGVTFNFVLWGLWHGMGLLVQNRWSAWARPVLSSWREKPAFENALSVLGAVATFHYVALGWIWFVIPEPALGWQFFSRLWGGLGL